MVDGWQKQHRVVAFPLAVVKKFGEDNAGNLAAVLAWNALASVFPLLLVLVTVLGVLLRGDPHLQQRILHSALADFPIIGSQIRQNVHSLNRTGVGLVVGLLGTFLGARGVAGAAQTAFNSLWEVPYKHRPGFPSNLVRSVALMTVVGTGVVATSALAGAGGGAGALGAGLRIAAITLAFALNVGLFLLGFRLAVAPAVATHDLVLGAVLAAAGWQALQALGGYLVAHTLQHADAVYGMFGLVLGLMSWLYLQAQLTLYAVEADVVRTRHLWPRTIAGPARTREDEHTLTAYGKVEERRDDQEVDVDFR